MIILVPNTILNTLLAGIYFEISSSTDFQLFSDGRARKTGVICNIIIISIFGNIGTVGPVQPLIDLVSPKRESNEDG